MRLFSVVFLLFVLLPSLSFADCGNRINSIQSVGDMKAAFSCLNEKIKRLEQGLGDNGKIYSVPKPRISQTLTESEIKYDLLGCSNNNGKVECELRVTRLGTDTDFSISMATKIFDENGQEYGAYQIKIGNYYSDAAAVRTTLISNSLRKVILIFRNFFPKVNKISKLNIIVKEKHGSWVEFKNIALKR